MSEPSHEDLFFQIKGHQYVVSPHLGTDGIKVIDAMLKLGIGPIVEAVFGAMALAKPDDKDAVVSLAEVLKVADKAAIISSLQRGITEGSGWTKLAPLVFAHTTRDGQNLGSKDMFDAAFSRNYGEAARAFRKVVEVNGFFDALVGFISEVDG